MKRHSFLVVLEFDDNIDGEGQIKEIGKNIAKSISHTCNTIGIIPNSAQTFTTKIEVAIDGIIIETLDLF